MFAIRCTRKLLNRGAPKTLADPVPPTTVLGDWYANIVFARPEQVVICVSERTLLPVIVTAKDVKQLPERVAQATEEILAAIGVPQEDADAELLEMGTGYLAVTADRRVLGSLNDFVFHFEHGVASDASLSLQERALRLANMPCGALQYAFPKESALAAFAAARVLKTASSAA